MMEAIQNFIQTLARMQWSDYADILVVSFLIYKLLPLIRTPNIMRIARTVIALLLVTWITEELHLYTINWILDQVLAIGLLAFVVLFQPELRRMLDHLGSVQLRSFFGMTKPVQEMDAVINQVVMACEIMSKQKVGALIVFSRETHLDEYFKTGTVIDGQVTEQLLRNIFFKNSPLHDGAMIIRDGRVAAAGCVLPLSTNPNIPRDLGTRHHAAVGMSEVSDAVVVTVSEETGVISVATGGMLKRYLAPRTLDKLLHNELCPAEKASVEEGNVLTKLRKAVTKSKEADSNEKE
nr:diadenylate cyclase CdaA [Oscillospiraceae bacterium]